jgi:hypothetical protein
MYTTNETPFFSLSARLPKVVASIEHLSITVKAVAFFTMFIAPLSLFIQVLIFFLIIDMMVSVYLQYKQLKKKVEELKKPKQPGYCFVIMWHTYKPEKLVQTVEKIILYSLVLIIAFVLDYFAFRTGLDPDGRLPIVSTSNTVFIILLGAESGSIFKKAFKITNNSVFLQIGKLIASKTGYEPQNPTQ